MWATRHEMRMQNRMDLVFDTRAMADDLVATRYEAPQALGIGWWRPYLGQETCGMEICQNASIDFVGLNVRVGNRPDLQRISDDNSRHERREDPRPRAIVLPVASTTTSSLA